MVDKRGLQSERYAVTAVEATIGSVIPVNMRRYIYRVKVQDDSVAANLVELKSMLAGAAAVVVDQFQLITPSETYVDPDELKEDALPLYIIPGSTAAAARTMRAVGTGNASLLLEYEDAE
jgi:hypothetical protein